MRDVMILSRPEAVSYCERAHDRPSVMVSISDPSFSYPDAPFRTPENGILEILSLTFCDAEVPGPDVYGNPAGPEDLMQEADALGVRRLLEDHPGCRVIVHCDAGMSRSAGVAAAILEAGGGDADAVFDSPWYDPNLHCYSLTLRVLRRDGGQ